MDKTDQQSEIKKLVTSLLNNLNLEIEDEYINDNNILGSEIFYLEIFKEIFNNLSELPNIELDIKEGMKPGSVIQMLIDK